MDLNVRDFIAKEVPDWNDEVIAVARFKAFSGQRSDWQPNFIFWRNLIIKIATHFRFPLIKPSQVKNVWFNRGGLTPLCIDDVMDKAAEVVKHLSESHWNSSCIITMKKFQEICGGPDEASVMLRYLSGCGTAQYLSVLKNEFVEGVKISLSAAALSGASNLDCDVLYLIWTIEKLQQQLDVIDRRCELSRKSALASLHSGNRKLALRYARELKLVTQSREKCSSLLNRVEEVHGVIVDAESTKTVSEAMQIGARAIKENKISVEDVDICLRDLQESIDSQKEVEKALEQTPSYTDINDEDIEEELEELELALEKEAQVDTPEKTTTSEEGTATLEASELLSDTLSNLRLSDRPVGKSRTTHAASEGHKTVNLAM